MLADAGATAVIVGHSERRKDHGETERLVNAKARAAHRAGPDGHHLRRRDRGGAARRRHFEIVGRQLEGLVAGQAPAPANTVIAYEPVWAIGQGLRRRRPTSPKCMASSASELGRSSGRGGERRSAHPLWRLGEAGQCQRTFIVPDVDGALVGGASLNGKRLLCNPRGLCRPSWLRAAKPSWTSPAMVGKRGNFRHCCGVDLAGDFSRGTP